MGKTEKWFKLFKINQKGFTLVELVVVIAIIGFLTAIAVPLYGNITAKAEEKVNEANIKIILGAIDMYRAENGFDSKPTLDDLKETYLSEKIKPPKSSGKSYIISYDEKGVPSVTTSDQDEGDEG
ncbi:MAG: type II secretion system protein [Dethiobacteria bacterium]|jgi:prepilin-type N-terminal cleavage/methylation domain-containing protein